jgi:hypothetical protein
MKTAISMPCSAERTRSECREEVRVLRGAAWTDGFIAGPLLSHFASTLRPSVAAVTTGFVVLVVESSR